MFLNVDLEIESAYDLEPLVEALEPHACSLERPVGRACFELNFVSPAEPEPLIQEFLRLISALPPSARDAWDRASRRVFDLGFQSVQEPFQTGYNLSAETLRAIAAIGADVAVTIYAVDPAETAARR